MCQKRSEVEINEATLLRESLVAKDRYIQNQHLYQRIPFSSQVFPTIPCARTSEIFLF